MNRRLRTILTQVGSFVLAGLLLYLALRGLDGRELATALRDASYVWLIPLVVVVLLSHWIRAWRWLLLIDALPVGERPPRRISTVDAFGSLMVGYMVNYAAPRLGEVVRTANLSTRRKIRFSSLFGTVVVERILDVVILVLGLGSVVFLLRGQLGMLHRVFILPLQEELGVVLMLALMVGTVAVGAGAALIVRSYVRQSEVAADFWQNRLRPVARSFRDGIMTLVRARRRSALVLSTLAIWFCYTLAAYLPFVLLNMHETFGIDLVDAWSIMLLGAVGVALPSPGGTGTYHFITIVVLTTFFGVARAPAAAYAVLTHASQLVLYALVGFIALVVQGTRLRSVAQHAAEAREQAQRTEQIDNH